MKIKLITATLAICLLFVGSHAANARHGDGGGYGPPTWSDSDNSGDDWRGHHSQSRHEMVAEILGLTEEQQEKIDAIREEERDANEGLRDKLRQSREQIQELTDTGTFDEKAVRAIAAKQAEIQVELGVSKARMHSRIHALMTPEQQELAARLRNVRKGRKGDKDSDDRRGPRRGPGRR